MECEVCMELFDVDERRPLLLDCAHTFCRDCVTQLLESSPECPLCRQGFVGPVDRLRTNFLVVRLISAGGGGANGNDTDGQPLWCSDCAVLASQDCVAAAHRVLGPQAALWAHVKEGCEQQLGQGRGDAVSRAVRSAVGRCGDEAALAALAVLAGPSCACLVTVEPTQPGARGGPGGTATTSAATGAVPLMTARCELGGAATRPPRPPRQGEDGDDDEEEEVGGDPLLGMLVALLASKAGLREQPEVPAAETPEENAEEEEEPEVVLELLNGEQQQQQEQGNGQEKAEVIHVLRMPPSVNLATAAAKKKKDEYLELVRLRGVLRLENLTCDRDPDWALQLLRFAAPTLVELHVVRPKAAHLAVVAASMPALRRLAVVGDDALHDDPPELPLPQPTAATTTTCICGAAASGVVGGLRSLKLTEGAGLPRRTLASLLRAHGASLRRVELRVGTAASPSADPTRAFADAQSGGHGDADDGVGGVGAGLERLRELLLVRGAPRAAHADAAECARQMASLRRVLPCAVLLCTACDDVEPEEF